MTVPPETTAFIKRLVSFARPGGGLPYYKGDGPSAEPTLLALLALSTPGSAAGGEAAKSLLAWVLGLQNGDGSLGLNPSHRGQGLWLTALAAVAFERRGLAGPRDRALTFLSSVSSVTVANTPGVRQDNGIVGWPWVRGTFGWVEPTAWSVIALSVCGRGGEARAAEGVRFLLDRQIPSGGWNYGNPGINDRELLPFWDTTGLALVALGGRTEAGRVRASLDFLETNQDKIASLCGLAWTVMGLETWGREAARLRQRLVGVMNAPPDDGLNAAYFAAGMLALSGRKVFAP